MTRNLNSRRLLGRAAAAVALLALHVGVGGCVVWNAERDAPPIGRFFDVDGAKMHALELGAEHAGDGPPIVLIHGASVNLRDMKIALGERLAESRRVIMIDRPGRGYSTRPRDGYALDVQARLIHETLEAMGVKKPVVVGQSFGGAVALAYALQYQDEMSGLVLLAPVTHPFEGGVAWYNHVSQWPVFGTVFRRAFIPVYAPIVARGGVTRSFAPNAPPANYFEEAGVPLLFRAKDFKANASDLTHLNRALVAQSPAYPTLRVPTIIYAGEDDTTVGPEIHAKHLARDVASAKLTMLPKTGHALHHAEAARIAASILAVGVVADAAVASR
ncbi:MAG: alpha/beta hydrolase [Parvularculaceae bacterium]|nr:alpha/beta hydrolase [Parvularculaceae bacterium]